MAIHRFLDSPRDRIVFDTGHRAYVDELLTGRMAGFAKLAKRRRQRLPEPGGVRARHRRDFHASTALSYADGLAKAYTIRGEDLTSSPSSATAH